MVNFIAIFLTTRMCSEPQIKHYAKPQHVSRQCSEPQKPTDKPTKTEIKSVNLRL